jgi:hypothetical protein
LVFPLPCLEFPLIIHSLYLAQEQRSTKTH